MWSLAEVTRADFTLADDKDGDARLEGVVEVATKSGDRRYSAAFFGRLAFKGDRLSRFDVVARGAFEGAGTYTATAVPPGVFTLALAFRIAAEGEPARVPPQGFRDRDLYVDPVR